MPDGSYFLIMALGGCMEADRGRVPNKGRMTLGNIRRSQPGMGHHSSCSPDDSRSVGATVGLRVGFGIVGIRGIRVVWIIGVVGVRGIIVNLPCTPRHYCQKCSCDSYDNKVTHHAPD